VFHVWRRHLRLANALISESKIMGYGLVKSMFFFPFVISQVVRQALVLFFGFLRSNPLVS